MLIFDPKAEELDLEKFDIRTTNAVINDYKYADVRNSWHKDVLRGMQFMYEDALNAAIDAQSELELSLGDKSTIKGIADDILGEFLPAMAYKMATSLAETLISFLDEEYCEEESDELETATEE
jgi:hypothetical protein